jgi:RNA polymerase sigma factor (TIGR02999 family)
MASSGRETATRSRAHAHIPDAATGSIAAAVAAMRPAGPVSNFFLNPANPLPVFARSVIMLRVSDVTHILSAIEQGDPSAAERLLPLVYGELRKLAAEKMAQEAPGQTLQATALGHEAYVRLVDEKAALNWNSRGHFFAAAAEAMRRILVENARRKRSLKHGGARQRVSLDEAASVLQEPADELLSLNDALDRLAEEDAKKAELVKLRYFTGLSVQEAAEALGISRATADRYWAYAKVWLYCALSGDAKPENR